MYSVSNAYKTAIKQPAIRTKVDGVIDDIPFDDDNILAGSFSITNQNSDNDSLKIGTVYTGELKITLRGVEIDRYSIGGKKIVPDFYLKIPTGWEDVPLGEFYVAEANHTAAGVEITAYDVVSKLDKKFSGETYVGTPYALALTACTQCGVTLATTSAQFAAFANGTETLSYWADGSDIETWRDFASWVAQACGCYITASRDGKIVFRPYNQTVVDTVDSDERFKGASFSDYETRYTGIYVTSLIDNIMYYYGQTVDDALTYSCGANPFLQYGTDADRTRIRRAVLNALSSVDYVPFEAELPENPAYDLGDVVRFSNGLADGEKLFCVNKYTWNYHKSIKLEGVGENPNLASARSKVDKNIAGLMSQTAHIATTVASLKVTTDEIEGRVEDAEGNIATLTTTVGEISGEVSSKADKSAGSLYTFRYSLTASGFSLASNNNTVMNVTADGANIAGWNITASKIYHPKATGNDGVGMIYSGGTSVPSLWRASETSPVVFYAGATNDQTINPYYQGSCYFGVLQDGSVYCQAIKATGGSIENLTVAGRLYFGNNSSYYIDANMNDSAYYINLPGFKVDDRSGAVFSGTLSAPSGNIAGMTISGDLLSFSGAKAFARFGLHELQLSNVALPSSSGITGISLVYDSQGTFQRFDIMGATLKSCYGNSGTLITSDADKKHDIEDLDDRYDAFFDALKPMRFKYNDGTSGRFHTGFIANDVKDAIDGAELTEKELAAYATVHGEKGDYCALRYDEFVALNTLQIQKLKQKIKQLEQLIGERV